MSITIIAAIDRNRALGVDNHLLFRLHNDMKHFKSLTTGHTVIMGRNTFLSLPKGALPNRRNIVISRTVNSFPGCETFRSLDEALDHCDKDEDVFIIGGASLYEEALRKADHLSLTEVDAAAPRADVWFPPFNGWKEVAREHHDADERNDQAYDFVDYVRA